MTNTHTYVSSDPQEHLCVFCGSFVLSVLVALCAVVDIVAVEVY